MDASAVSDSHVTQRVMLTFITRLKLCLLGFSSLKLFSPFHLLFFGSKLSPHSEGEGSKLCLLGRDFYIYYLEIFCREDRSPLIYSVICIRVDSVIFILFFGLYSSFTFVVLLLRFFSLWPLGIPSFRFLCPFDMILSF